MSCKALVEVRNGEVRAGEVLEVLGKPAAAAEPSERSLHDPALGQDEKPLRLAAFDDLERQAGCFLDGGSGRGILIAAVGIGALREREEAAHLSEKRPALGPSRIIPALTLGRAHPPRSSVPIAPRQSMCD